MPDKSHLTIAESDTIEQAFQRLNANMLGILFARDADGRVIGAVTDGDIRRRLLTGISIQGEVASCINRNFVWARAGAPREQILKLLDQRVHVVPILDADGRLVDVFSRDLFNLGEESEVFARARSPVRISFSGGGTDLTHYFVDNDGGSVINATIAMYAHATLRRRNDNRIRIYSHDFRCTVEAENLAGLGSEGELALIKSVVRLIQPAYGFDLDVSADFPVGSGLGGSAVVSSAIIGCFNEFRSDRWDRHEIAEMAFQAERLMLNIPGGWQDQYATVFGGFNHMEFSSEQNTIVPLRLEPNIIAELEESLVLCYTGSNHDSGSIHRDQKQQHETQRRRRGRGQAKGSDARDPASSAARPASGVRPPDRRGMARQAPHEFAHQLRPNSMQSMILRKPMARSAASCWVPAAAATSSSSFARSTAIR